MFTFLWLATVMPDFRGLWTSYTGDQANIGFYEIAMPFISQSERFQKFLPEGMKSLKKKPYPQINIQIPGTNLPDELDSLSARRCPRFRRHQAR